MNNYIKLMTVLLVSHQITNAMMVVKPKATSIKTPPVNLRAPVLIPYAKEVEGQNDSSLQPGLVPSAPSLEDDAQLPLAAKSTLAQAVLLSHDKKTSNEIQGPVADTPIVVKVIPAASCDVPAPLLLPKDQKSAVEVRVVAPAIEGAQAAAVEGPLAPMASSLTAATAAGTQQTSEKETVNTLTGNLHVDRIFCFNGKFDDFSKLIRKYDQQRAEGILSLGSKLYKQYQEKFKKEYPAMPEFIINYVLGKTYDCDKTPIGTDAIGRKYYERRYFEDRYILLDLCEVGFPFLNSKKLWVTNLKNEGRRLDDIDARAFASTMIKKSIMCRFGKKWYARYGTNDADYAGAEYFDPRSKSLIHFGYPYSREIKVQIEIYYRAMIELWKKAQKSENPADKHMLTMQVPFALVDPKEKEGCSVQ